ncbi:MAG: haloacid dehalogenase type II [Halorhodospira sp.]
MAPTLAFDIYGTLMDTNGVTQALRPHLGDRALAFSCAWRAKQLEYAFRRTVMGWYAEFTICIAEALDYTACAFHLSLTEADRAQLLGSYQRLPAFQDAELALRELQEAGYVSYAFSNGSRETVSKLLGDNALRTYVRDIVSVETVAAFKPSPQAYEAFQAAAGSRPEETWLVSSNPFDIIGAQACGWRTVWVRRLPGAVFDPWGQEPDVTVASLADLPRYLPPA